MSGQPRDAILHDYNGEWADADFGHAKPGEGAALSPTAASTHGVEQVAAKVAVSVRLSRDIVDHFRAAGLGWEARIEDVLRKAAAAEREAAKHEPGAEPRHEFVSDGHEG